MEFQDISEKNTSLIYRYAEDLTKKNYYTDPSIARDEVLKKMILTLFTPEKSPILVGKPGIGKTAIVEGLAWRIQNGLVPDALKDYTILKIDTAALVGNISDESGTTDMKLQVLVKEIEEMHNVILFIDETHTLIGNKAEGGLDFANILKPALSRGNIKMIGATTSDEYDYYIVKDLRVREFNNTIDIVKQGFYTTENGTKYTFPDDSEMRRNTIFYDKEFRVAEAPTLDKPTIIEVKNTDCLYAGVELKEIGRAHV